MSTVHKYHLFPTERIPNSPRPLLHYKNAVAIKPNATHCDPLEVWKTFNDNGWRVSWIFRYGSTQLSHYHSQAHECMAVLSGTATIRFGVADTSENMEENTNGSAWEDGGVELDAEAGDVFVIPAGVAHKTYNTKPEEEFVLLTPGHGRGVSADEIAKIKLNGYTMLGAYSGGDWDFVKAGGDYEKIWSLPKPEKDPVFGKAEQGLCKLWPGGDIETQSEIIEL